MSSSQRWEAQRRSRRAQQLLAIAWRICYIIKDVREVAAKEFPDEQAAGKYDSLGEPGASNKLRRHGQSRVYAYGYVRENSTEQSWGREQRPEMDCERSRLGLRKCILSGGRVGW